MVNTRTDYPPDAVAAARAVMLELVRLLGEYRDDMVIVGGWVPELLMPSARTKHIGSTDVDLALDYRRITEAGYRTIREHLLRHGYLEGKQPFIFFREVPLGGRTVMVQVDFLAGEYGGAGRGHRTQPVQDMAARKARGCELALEMNTRVRIEGRLPGGGLDAAEVRVAGIVPFIVMKGMALHDRLKPKDSWDIQFCLANYPGGLDALVREFRPHLQHGLVEEGLRKIREKFLSPDHVGPRSVADFEELTDPDARALLQRDAFERVSYLLAQLGVA
ncbi:MAG TPA: hypothetical protein VLT62_21595 [Candidatus Methylomirabilis sp.]|nr:hypothetical protein [Candidatus Methylomirabilis sp.]